jgi:hypothetical protein
MPLTQGFPLAFRAYLQAFFNLYSPQAFALRKRCERRLA